MKNETIQKISMAINALNNVTVSGEQNMQNLLGSIAVMREIVEQMKKEASTLKHVRHSEMTQPERSIESDETE